MNREEAKSILLLYRPGTADADDPQIAGALALAKEDAELSRWLEEHCALQESLRAKFRQIPAPAGLKEQIISEHAVTRRILFWRPKALIAVAAMLVAMLALASFWFHSPSNDNTLAIYQSRMAGIALRGYNMDLVTNDPGQIRVYLAQNHAPADYMLPVPLQKAELTGCAIESWQGARVAMICFRTGKPLAPGEQSDLWLFVVDHSSVNGAPIGDLPQFTKVNQLTTAIWTRGGKFYLLGAVGDESSLRKFL